MIHAIEDTIRRAKEFSLFATKPLIPDTNLTSGRKIDMTIKPPYLSHLLELLCPTDETKYGLPPQWGHCLDSLLTNSPH